MYTDKLKKFKYYLDSLCVYGLNNESEFDDDDTFFNNLMRLLDKDDSENIVANYSRFFKSFAAYESLRHCISNKILTDDNIFTKAAAAGKANDLPKAVIDGVKSDLKKLEEISTLTLGDIIESAEPDEKEILLTLPRWETGKAQEPLGENWSEQTDALIEFHRENGYGKFVENAAFSWSEDEELIPITSLDTITLNDLKNYEAQRNQVIENTVSFLEGFPANNILLYGDRGTGKSSTVHAILNEYRNKGLRMIEISKGDINNLTKIRELIADSPIKFIIFIDDLSFDSHDDSFGELKAALEGSLSGRQSNTLIYATSNRRHLIKENFSDRENDIHRSDTMQEELSLSDRFGLSIYFENPDKKNFLDITEKIAKDRNLNVDYDKLLTKAELWARRRGGRSPRGAKQFIDYVESCEKRKINW